MNWVEVSFTVEAELAEPVAELLGRLAPRGVALHPAAGVQAGPGAAAPLVEVRAYLPDDASLPDRKRRLEEGVWHLGQIRAIPDPVFRAVEEQDWAESWKAGHQPFAVGRRFLVLPEWEEAPPGSPRLVMRIDPGMAFGTGAHASTRLCLQAMEENLAPGARVVDLGCGSGILAVAAARLGAEHVLAVDTDPMAVQAAQANVRLNAVEGTVRVIQGSLAEVMAEWPEGADGVVANIYASVLVQMLGGGLAQAVRPGGILVLSGVLAEQFPEVRAAAAAAGVRELRVLSEGDWRALVLQRDVAPLVGGDVGGSA